MTGNDARPRLSFPQIRRIILDNFSLYSQRPSIELEVIDGVVCLAGANGIGKSTFLSAVIFGLTGIVPQSSHKFMSAAEYYKDGLRFSEAFFEGRVAENDRDSAQITIDFDIGVTSFHITRGFFELGDLRALSMTSDGQAGGDGESLTGKEMQDQYASRVAAAVGVQNFEQYVFLQHFVLTFDESRHLLFWDPRALEQALYLAFGADSEIAGSAERLRREMEKAESQARNIQFHATSVFTRIQALEDALETPVVDTASETELWEEYDRLLMERERQEEELDRVAAKIADAEVALTAASAALVTLRKDYELGFSRMTGRRSVVDAHPLIRATLSDERCALCGTGGDGPTSRVRRALQHGECPLCESPLQTSASNGAELIQELKEIDAALAKAAARLDTCASTRSRLANEKARRQEEYALAQEAVQGFETRHEAAITRKRGALSAGSTVVTESLDALRTEYRTLQAKKEAAYVRRDEKKKELRVLQHSLESSYAIAEEEFVPQFRALAELFLGIELDISLEGKSSTGLVLVLELRSTARREQHQLSESQRFFVDIALRMAMARFMSSAESPAGLLIDTPEGSLDIAYESRAGQMFAEFVKSGHCIMMTANINSSQLLKKLARECGPERMALTRMTTWTDLSEVQVEEDELFRDAYATIEEALRGADG